MALEFDDRGLRVIGCNYRGIQFFDSSVPPVLKAEIYLNADCSLTIGQSGETGSSTTPLTLTVSTTNLLTGFGHTHQILSSSNPGQSAAILASDSNGDLILQDLTLRGGDLRNDVGTLTITPTVTVASAAGAVLDAIKFNAGTVTVTGTATIATEPFGAYTFARPTIDFSSTASAAHAATVYIENDPSDPDALIDVEYALFVKDGQVYFGDKLRIGDIPGFETDRSFDIQKTYVNFGSQAALIQSVFQFNANSSSSPHGLQVLSSVSFQAAALSLTGTPEGGFFDAVTGASSGSGGTLSTLIAVHGKATNGPGSPSSGITVTNLLAGDFQAQNTVDGTTTSAYALRARVEQGSSGVDGGPITTAYGLWVDILLSSGSNAITTSYGIYVDTLYGTTTYGLYIKGPETLALWVDSGKTRLDTAVTVASAAGAVLDAVSIPADTITITGATGITTATGFNLVNIGQSTYSAASALTITNAATLYIANSPLGGGAGPVTITNSYSLWVDAGGVRLDTAVALGGGAAPTFGTIGGTGPAAAAQNEWIRIDTQNGVRFVPAWA